jgi:hypothetical protein
MKIKLLLLILLATGCRQGNDASAPAPSEPVPPTSDVRTDTPSPGMPPTTPPAAAPAAPPATEPAPPAATTWSFDADAVEVAPAGFDFSRTGDGSFGRWLVRADATAPSAPNVLVQLDDDDTSFRFPVAVATAPVLRDARVQVRCKMISGRVDQACGLVLRYRDENNYYITRANTLENNIRLYYVRGGKREQLASWSGKVTANTWHDYRFEARGDHIEVFWNGQRVLDHHDGTFPDAGRVGVWTKADSVTYFDDFQVEAL